MSLLLRPETHALVEPIPDLRRGRSLQSRVLRGAADCNPERAASSHEASENVEAGSHRLSITTVERSEKTVQLVHPENQQRLLNRDRPTLAASAIVLLTPVIHDRVQGPEHLHRLVDSDSDVVEHTVPRIDLRAALHVHAPLTDIGPAGEVGDVQRHAAALPGVVVDQTLSHIVLRTRNSHIVVRTITHTADGDDSCVPPIILLCLGLH